MASRAEQKAQARARRIEAEQAERRAARRRATMLRLGLVLSMAVVVVIVAVIISTRGSSGGPGNGQATAGDGAAAVRLFHGIPQSGVQLGTSSSAPTLIEFADLQCPYCAAYNDAVLTYNNQRETFPTSVLAGMFNFAPAALWEIGPDRPETREAPKVQF